MTSMVSSRRQETSEARSAGSDRGIGYPRAFIVAGIYGPFESAAQSGPIVSPAQRANIIAMDAANPSATPTFASRTPLHIGAIALAVRDLDRLTAFYRDVL